MSANIGWLFYKDYFKKIDYHDLESKKNEETVASNISNIISQTPEIAEADILGTTHFTATTTYPGLLLGSGNAHELPGVTGQAILGFHFDYASGLPAIQGSSIKGVLRSAFKHDEYIQELLKVEGVDIKALESEIFDNGDTFFDATISKADEHGKVLGDDYITPHSNPLKDPIPLRFLKVLPSVTFRFDFELSDGLISKEQKSKLFQQILEDLGLGAKTNVGYGKFVGFLPFKTEKEKEDAALNKEYNEAKESENIQIIENFIKNFPDHDEIEFFISRKKDLEEKQQNKRFEKVDADASRAWDELQKKKSNKNQYQKNLDKFIKKWGQEKNHKNSPFVLDLMNKLR